MALLKNSTSGIHLASKMKILSVFVCFVIICANFDHCVADQPRISIDFVKAVGPDSVYLGWTVADNNDPVEKYFYLYFKNGSQLPYYSKPISTIYNDEVLMGLDNGTSYEFGLMAINSFGESEIAYSNSVTTLERDPDFTPTFTIEATSSDSITIRGDPLPAELQDYVHYYSVMASKEDEIKGPVLWTDIEKPYVLENLTSATSYQLKVSACNGYTARCGEWSDEQKASTTNKVGQGVSAIWPSSVAVVVVLVVVMVVWLGVQKHRERARMRRFILATLERFNAGALDSLDPELNVADQAELLPYDKKWEFPRELLILDNKVLGRGAFGVVKKAQAKSICKSESVTTVAVKVVRSTASLNHMTALTRELKILAHLGKHINIVNLLGACTKRVSYGQLLVIVEFCRFGNLRNYLLRYRADFIDQVNTSAENITEGSSNSRNSVNTNDEGIDPDDSALDSATTDRSENPDSSVKTDDSEDGPIQLGHITEFDDDYEDENLEPICTRDLLCWAWQVSRGMKYLGTRRVLHGDLAARNILLADNNVVKICDFGLAKALYEEDHYRKRGHGPIPIKWMAIEAIRERLFSVQSDVWSYGIVLWEFFTLGETPYPGIDNEHIYRKIADGYRLPQPKYASKDIYQMMLRCWDEEPSNRPSFKTIMDSFDDLLDESVTAHYFDLDAPYAKMNADALAHGGRDYLTMSPSKDTFEETSV